MSLSDNPVEQLIPSQGSSDVPDVEYVPDVGLLSGAGAEARLTSMRQN